MNARFRARVLAATAVASCVAVVGAQTAPIPGAAQSTALRIVVLAGEDVVNIIQQRTAVAPIVEVRDRNNNPVAGAVVTFSIQGGQNATFGGSLQSLTMATNAAGRAAAVGLSPTASGAVQINVAATFQGQAAAATITQTNVMTAAQAAAAGSGAGGSSGAGAGGGSGGGFPTGLVTAAGAGAAGAVVVATQTDLFAGNRAPEICMAAPLNTQGFVDVTAFTATVEGCDYEGDPVTYAWDFGDGTTANTPSVSHVYRTTGTFSATLVVSDGKDSSQPSTFTITIASLTGRWRVGTTNDFFDLVQSQTRVTGTYTSPAGSGSGTVSGTFQHPVPVPNISLTLSSQTSGTLTANTAGSLNVFNAIIVGGGYALPFFSTTLTRQ